MELALQLSETLLLGVSIFLCIFGLFRLPAPEEAPIHRRIALALGRGERSTAFEHPVFSPPLNAALLAARRLTLPNLRTDIRRHLDGTGNPNMYSVDEYLAICIVCGLSLGLLTAFLGSILLGGFNLLITAFMGVVGYWIPVISLKGEARRRARQIARQLPYTLDLIALMMAAGSTFTEAVQVVIREDPENDLNQELQIVLSEIDFGAKRSTALVNMADRINTDSMRSIVGAVNQAESLGTPLSEILKSQSDMLRLQRSVMAEKISASASLRILVPSMLILVAAVIFLFGPLILQFAKKGLF